jgi:hypothetical protein
MLSIFDGFHAGVVRASKRIKDRSETKECPSRTLRILIGCREVNYRVTFGREEQNMKVYFRTRLAPLPLQSAIGCNPALHSQ